MRVFVTGASGWIGSAVIAELLAQGHEVLGLARSDAAAETVAASGAEVLRGDVQDIGILRAGAERADGVVHLAFRHDVAWSGHFDQAAASDRGAIEVFGEVLAGSDRPLAIASGVAGLKPGGIATERDHPDNGMSPRVASEQAALALAKRGVRSISVRFAPTVHGTGDHGFIARIIDADRSHGAAGYVGDGENRWPAVHRCDAARLVGRGIEHAPAGSVLHAVAEEGVAMRDIAKAISRRYELPATRWRRRTPALRRDYGASRAPPKQSVRRAKRPRTPGSCGGQSPARKAHNLPMSFVPGPVDAVQRNSGNGSTRRY